MVAAGVIVGAVTEIAKAGKGFIDSFEQAKAIKAQAEYEAAIQEINARMGDFLAADAIQRGEREAKEYGQEIVKLQGTTLAQLAAQGIDVTTGSAAAVVAEFEVLSARDMGKIRVNAAREAFGHKAAAIGFRFEGGLAKLAAKSKSRLNILGSALNLSNAVLTGGLKVGLDANETTSSSEIKGENSFTQANDPGGPSSDQTTAQTDFDTAFS